MNCGATRLLPEFHFEHAGDRYSIPLRGREHRLTDPVGQISLRKIVEAAKVSDPEYIGSARRINRDLD